MIRTGKGNSAAEPQPDCPICPRLVAFRHDVQISHSDWHNAPVPSFGDSNGRLLIVGLAPGMKGANRTGRPFTGDYAGDLLYKTLISRRFARGRYEARPDDGLKLTDCLITNAVRCLPPQNKPTGAEIKACRPFLLATMAQMPNLTTVLALGRIAHETFLSAIGARRAAFPFGHNAAHDLGDLESFEYWRHRPAPPPGHPREYPLEGGRVGERAGAAEPKTTLTLFDSYHCSRYNTNTGRLTETMFNDVFDAIDRFLERSD